MLMQGMNTSNFRPAWRVTNLLTKGTPGASTQKDVKNEDSSSEFIENKGAKEVLLRS